MKPSAISWADFSGGNLNFVSGCTPVSESCTNCYARAIYERFGKDFSKVTWSEEKLNAAYNARYELSAPAVSDRLIYKRGYSSKPLCFVCDTGDLLHPSVPDEFIERAFTIMRFRRFVDWVVLTKRPERLATIPMLSHHINLDNVLMGVTAENQARADERIPILLANWAGPKFVSVEPMLEDITIQDWLWGWRQRQAISWVICGAESGNNRRLFDVKWAKHLYQQCSMEEVSFFCKQDSGLYPGIPLLIDGKVIHEWPESR